MNGFSRPIRSLFLSLSPVAAILVAGLAGGAFCLAAPPETAPATVDPQPPMVLTVEVISLQKNALGGVASLLLRVNADVSVEGAVVSAKAPANLVFADGSAVKSWNVDLTTADTLSIPVDVIVPQDGKYVVTAEVSGTARGKAIHRGAACRLLVGVREPTAKVRGGAIEYQAAEAGEPRP
jgi:hypothetical protein